MIKDKIDAFTRNLYFENFNRLNKRYLEIIEDYYNTTNDLEILKEAHEIMEKKDLILMYEFLNSRIKPKII